MSEILKAASIMDWQQVVLNGGPPCFHLEKDGRFCGRAGRWHDDQDFHKFTSLHDLLTTALARAESLELEQFIPGCFVCPKCDFGLVKSTIYMGSGNIGPTISNAVERCPNDNEAMVKETWRMRVEGLSKVCETQIKRAVESETRNRQLVQAIEKAVKVLDEGQRED